MKNNQRSDEIKRKQEIYSILKELGGAANMATIELKLKRKYPRNTALYHTNNIRKFLQTMKGHGFIFFNQSVASWQLTNKDNNKQEI